MQNKLIGLAVMLALLTSSCGLLKNTKSDTKRLKIEQSTSSNVSLSNVSTSQEQVKITEVDKSSSRFIIEEMETATLPGRSSNIIIDAGEVKKGAVTLLDSFGNVFIVKLDTVSNKLGIGLKTPPIDLLKKKTTSLDGNNDISRIIHGLKNQNDSTALDSSSQQQSKTDSKDSKKESKFDLWGLVMQVLPILAVVAVLFFIIRKFYIKK